MKKSRRIKVSIVIAIIAVFSAFLMGCSKPVVEVNQNESKIATEPCAQVEGQEIYLYPIKVDEEGMSTGFIVAINGKSQEFSWKGMTDNFTGLYSLDLNDDDKDELVVSLNLGHGTGLKEDEFHIIDTVTMQEIFLESPKEILNKHVKLYNTQETMSLEVPTEVFSIRRSELKEYEPLSDDFGLVPMGCSVENERLVTTYAICVNNSSAFVGDLKIHYSYQKDGFYLSSIAVEKIME